MIGAWWRRLTRRAPEESRLDAELRDHLERQVAELVAAGHTAAEARRRAQLSFGTLDAIKEQCRDARGTRWLEDIARDLRYSLRMLRRAPVFTATVVLSLALGIGGVTALFSVFNALALRKLPVPQPEQLVTLAVALPDRENPSFPYPTFDHLRTHTRTLSGLFAYTYFARVNVGTADASELTSNALVSGDYFGTLGVRPGLGRLFTTDDDREGVQVVVLSDAYWRRRFGADPGIAGRRITINAQPFTVIGVTPPGFTGANVGSAPELFIPLRARDRLVAGEPWWDKPYTWLELTGRLRDGVTREQAQAELDSLFQQTQRARLASVTDPAKRPQAEADLRATRLVVAPAAEGVDSHELRARLSRALCVLLGIASAVLLIACLNIANLLLARATARRHEMAVRLAIGAGRARLVRQLLTETALLTALGATGGLAMALWLGPAIVRMQFPHAIDAPPLAPAFDARVFSFMALLALATASIFGVLPALRATRAASPGEALQARGATAHTTRARMDGALVIAQVALSVVLLVCATLFARSLYGLGARDAGYDRRNVLMFAVDPHVAGLEGDAVGTAYETLRARVASLPGVESSTVSVVRPVDEQRYFVGMVEGVDGVPTPREAGIRVASNIVGPRFFETFRIPLSLGREFDGRDRSGRPKVVVISATLARTLFGEVNPIGHTIDMTGPDGRQPHEIVGVAADIRYASLKADPRGVVYLPALQVNFATAPFSLSYALRTTQPPAEVMARVREIVRETHQRLPIDRMMTLDAETSASLARERVLATLSGYFAALALLLVSLGLYGLMAYLVIRRTAEIGVRLALGATTRAMRTLVVRGAARLIAAGLLLGLPAAFAVTRLLRSLLYDVTPRDPASFLTAITLLGSGALLAVWLPARRAARVDPCVALRAD